MGCAATRSARNPDAGGAAATSADAACTAASPPAVSTNNVKLKLAAAQGDAETVRLLCENPDTREAAIRSAFLRAVRAGHADVVRVMCELPLEARGIDSGALQLAIMVVSHADVVGILLSLPRSRVVFPKNLVARAITAAQSPKLLSRAWLDWCANDHGVNVNDLHQVLLYASAQGHCDVVRHLCALPAGYRVNLAARSHKALWYAAQAGQLNVMAVLCEEYERRVGEVPLAAVTRALQTTSMRSMRWLALELAGGERWLQEAAYECNRRPVTGRLLSGADLAIERRILIEAARQRAWRRRKCLLLLRLLSAHGGSRAKALWRWAPPGAVATPVATPGGVTRA